MGFFKSYSSEMSKVDAYNSFPRLNTEAGSFVIAFRGHTVKESKNAATTGDFAVNVEAEILHIFHDDSEFNVGDCVSLGWMLPSVKAKFVASPKVANYKTFVAALVGERSINSLDPRAAEDVEDNPAAYMGRKIVVVVQPVAKSKTGNDYYPTSFSIPTEKQLAAIGTEPGHKTALSFDSSSSESAFDSTLNSDIPF